MNYWENTQNFRYYISNVTVLLYASEGIIFVWWRWRISVLILLLLCCRIFRKNGPDVSICWSVGQWTSILRVRWSSNVRVVYWFLFTAKKETVLWKTDTKSRSFGQLFVNMNVFHALQRILVTFNLFLNMLIR
jgi:hypothetical protein